VSNLLVHRPVAAPYPDGVVGESDGQLT